MKSTKFIKAGPHLPVKDLRLTLEYYRDQLGFVEEWTWGNLDGGIRRDDLRLLFVENKEFADTINNQAHRLALIWFVEHIDDIFIEFKNRGIEITDEIQAHPYGLKEFAFIDINGYYIRVAENIGEH
jgi:uncharacterized glyoxalase superfamily protein PhnB